ncbi:hypothetical protein BHE74_00033655, partial [Ensete ventricosum]
TINGGNRNTSKGGERQLGENKVTVVVATIVAKVYDNDEPLLLVSKPNQGGGMRFNPILEAANEDKDEEAYDEEEETQDTKQEDEFYGLLAAPCSRSANCIDGILWRPTPSFRVGGIRMIVMLQATLLSEEWRHRSYVVAFKMKVLPIGSLAPLCASIDLVTVLNMSPDITKEKIWMLKHAMRLVVFSLGLGDQFSIVAFSIVGGAKRLLPL